MTQKVSEIMNPEVAVVHTWGPAREALDLITAFGVSAAPVINVDGEVAGVISLRDLTGDLSGSTIGDRMTSPAIAVSPDLSVADAGRLICERGLHRAPVVDDHGAIVGMLAIGDVCRALLGMPSHRPDTFPQGAPSTA